MDERALPHVDVVGDAARLDEHFDPMTADEVLARHILEHFPFADTVRVLECWRWVLREGGKLRIEVPNLWWQAKALITGADHEEIVRLMYGDQDYAGNYHKAAFTSDLLWRRLDEAGFKGITVTDIGMVLVAEAYR